MFFRVNGFSRKAFCLLSEFTLAAGIFFLPAWSGFWAFPIGFFISIFLLAVFVFCSNYFLFKNKKRYAVFKSSIYIPALILLILINGKMVVGYQIFHIPTPSMLPTLLPGDFVIVDTWDKDYKKSDIVVFTHHEYGKDIYYVKRIIYAEGDSFHGRILDEKRIAVIGDNREESHDSRIYGAIKKEDVIGKVVWVAGSYNGKWNFDRLFLKVH